MVLFSFYRTCSKNYRKIQIHFLLMRFVFWFRQQPHIHSSMINRVSYVYLLQWQILYCNVGNPQSLGQQPVTYFREVSLLSLYLLLFVAMMDESLVDGSLLAHVAPLQVLSLCDHPALLDKSETHALYRYIKAFSIRSAQVN